MKAVVDSTPPEFCYKRGLDLGTPPVNCPRGYKRNGAVCQELCMDDYRLVIGICWQDCPEDSSDWGIWCNQGFFRGFFKHSYIPHTLTNYDSKVLCPKGKYKWNIPFPLCYNNCENIGMYNCGPGACAQSETLCVTSIITMIADVAMGIVDFVSFVVSLGTTSGATAMKNSVNKIGKNKMKDVLKSVKNIYKAFGRVIKQKAKNLLSGQTFTEWFACTAKGNAEALIQRNLAYAVCDTVFDTVITQSKEFSMPNTLDQLVSSLDVLGVKNIVTSCTDTSDQKGQETCAFSVISSLSNFDPTGIVTVASALMKPTCEVPDKPLVPSEVEDEIDLYEKEMNSHDDDCVFLYHDCGFKGTRRRYCTDRETLLSDGDKFSSMRVGRNVNGAVFEHNYYHGTFIPFHPGQTVECFSDVKLGNNRTLDNMVSSIRFKIEDCAIINFKVRSENNPDNSYNYFLCNSMNKVNIEIPFDAYQITFHMSTNKYYWKLYYSEDFQGFTNYVEKSNRWLDAKDLYIRERLIRSFTRHNQLNRVSSGCIELYPECNFEGDSFMVCGDVEKLHEKYDNKISSMRTGPNARGLLFDLPKFKGKVFGFG